jgi:hypothetical protein
MARFNAGLDEANLLGEFRRVGRGICKAVSRQAVPLRPQRDRTGTAADFFETCGGQRNQPVDLALFAQPS